MRKLILILLSMLLADNIYAMCNTDIKGIGYILGKDGKWRKYNTVSVVCSNVYQYIASHSFSNGFYVDSEVDYKSEKRWISIKDSKKKSKKAVEIKMKGLPNNYQCFTTLDKEGTVFCVEG